ncbi:MAG: D-glycero-beta-D-manno-heptose 1,7-bisphosphate 7-phosphatase [Acidiferrobacteraceae bacterium]|jgi:D-glycero-D-manno-heptose 1,7-bisphosphate phosphatase
MRLIILDRDGVINEDSDDYIKSVDEWIPVPGSIEAIARLYQNDYRIVVASNQSGIARGLFNMDALNRIHNRMIDAVTQKGGGIEAVFFCPHSPEQQCHCRKPRTGLFEEIADRLKVNLSTAYAVGDSLRDLEAARAVHARPALVRTGKGARTIAEGRGIADVPIFDDLAAFANALLEDRF